MLTVLLVMIVALLIGIWWDQGASARQAQRTRLAASDLNAEKLDAISERLDRLDRK